MPVLPASPAPNAPTARPIAATYPAAMRPARRGPAMIGTMLAMVPGTYLAAITPARAADVQITITNIRNARGDICASLCAPPDHGQARCLWRARAPATPGTLHLTITNVPPGTYAAHVLHDENANHKRDRNMLGQPTEGAGFSLKPGTSPASPFAQPRFADAAIEVPPAGLSLSIALRYPK